MSILTRKNELIEWISSVEDALLLDEIEKFKNYKTFDFDSEFKKGISSQELKVATTQYIKSLPWKKSE